MGDLAKMLFQESRCVNFLVFFFFIVAESIAERHTEMAIARHVYVETLPLEVDVGINLRRLEYISTVEFQRCTLVLQELYLQGCVHVARCRQVIVGLKCLGSHHAVYRKCYFWLRRNVEVVAQREHSVHDVAVERNVVEVGVFLSEPYT